MQIIPTNAANPIGFQYTCGEEVKSIIDSKTHVKTKRHIPILQLASLAIYPELIIAAGDLFELTCCVQFQSVASDVTHKQER